MLSRELNPLVLTIAQTFLFLARNMGLHEILRESTMPDLKDKLDRLLADAADCELIGRLAADAVKRNEFRQRAEKFRALAEEVRAQVTARPRSDIEFLLQQAERCRGLASGLADENMKADLTALASELESKANQERDAK